jgi:hypothetical protein
LAQGNISVTLRDRIAADLLWVLTQASNLTLTA